MEKGLIKLAELVSQFEQAASNVEPETRDKENAAKAHAEVRECLEADADLSAVGIDTVLIGSYKRQVSIRRVKDVDVFSRLPDVDMSISSRDLLQLFADVLKEQYGMRVEKQDRSVKIDFAPYGLHVDAVPARPAGAYWQIPDRSERGGQWQTTNPEGLTELSSAMNDRYNRLYVPVVKLIRQTRRAHIAKRPGGLFVEILTYHAFNEGLSGENLPQLYVAALRSVASRLQAVAEGQSVEDPTMPGATIQVQVSEGQMRAAAAKFDELSSLANRALEDDRCPAAAAYRECFGKNDDGDWIFPIPADCNDDGTEKNVTSVVAGDRHVPAGDRRFA